MCQNLKIEVHTTKIALIHPPSPKAKKKKKKKLLGIIIEI